MRIALASPFSWPEVRRGGERYLDDLAHWLRGAGHDVTVVTGQGHRVHRLTARQGLTTTDTFGLAAWRPLLSGRHDLVHALVPSAAVAGRLAGRRTVYTVLGLPTAAGFGRRPFDRRLLTSAVRRSTAVAAVSPAAAGAVADLTGRVPVVLPPGLREERFPLDPSPRPAPPQLLFPADAADPRKGLAGLLAAVDLLLARRPDVRLVLGGPGDPRPALRAATDRVRAATEVRGVGELADVPALYRSATVTVLPSRHEAFGLVLVESLASGTPVVSLAEGGPAGIVTSPEVGRTCPPGDPAALAAALEQALALARDPATPQRCAEHARTWHWAHVGPQHEDLYRRVLSGG